MMYILKRVGLCWGLLCLLTVSAACTQSAPPSPTPLPATPVPTFTDLPTPSAAADVAVSQGRVWVTALRALPMHSGPGADYARLTDDLPPDVQVVAYGRNASGTWLKVRGAARRGWIAIEDVEDVVITGDVEGLPIVSVPRITRTPLPPTETPTLFPTFTPRPTLTPRPTMTVAPTPEDRDSRAMPIHNLGVLSGDFDVTGEGTLSLLNDSYDYVVWQFDENMRGQLAIELEFTCSNPDVELAVSLYNTANPDVIERLYPVCNAAPSTIYALDAVGIYQLELWLRDARAMLDADATLEPDLQTNYTFRIRRP